MMLREVAPVTFHASPSCDPRRIDELDAVKLLITGAVSTADVTVKLCVTGVAAAYVLLPACEAVIEQVPAAIKVAVVPLTVQTVCVVEAKLTAKPEVAVAVSVSVVPTVCEAMESNVIFCAVSEAAFTAKLCVTGVAAAYLSLPACVAIIVQVPGSMKVAAASLTVQMSGVSEAKLTGSPELAVAVSVSVAPTVWPGMASNVIVDAKYFLKEIFPSQPLSISVPSIKNVK